MDEATRAVARFPGELVNWAGHRSGGVKRLFDEASGRPGKELLRTGLLSRLQSWVGDLSSGALHAPRIILLVGGPGNGKTEAIESTITWLDEDLHCDGALIEKLSAAFHPTDDLVPRLVEIDTANLGNAMRALRVGVVQDASATVGNNKVSAARLLIGELDRFLRASPDHAYLCCVNRGVLDDALIHAIDNGLDEPKALLETITRAVGLTADAPSCWPLEGFPPVAVWPMDAESLFVAPEGQALSPAAAMLAHATAAELWPTISACPAGVRCPFCTSREVLSRASASSALLSMLRLYELGSGQRWSFRDLFSLLSYFLSGSRQGTSSDTGSPCEWAARLLALDQSLTSSDVPTKAAQTALFKLATSGYEQALFHSWDPTMAISLRQWIRELEVHGDRTLTGLAHFLADRRSSYLPATISTSLKSFSDLLDPAMASPDMVVTLSQRTQASLREIDAAFSRSVAIGVEFIRKYQVLSQNELDLLTRLADSDERLSWPTIRRRRPAVAARIQHVLRDFSGRLVRRSIAAKSGAVADRKILEDYQEVVEDDAKGHRLYEVAAQVENLLNTGPDFEVPLTTTFGQPLPPRQRQATLIVPARNVSMLRPNLDGRPRPPICFLEVGNGSSAQSIALTYSLYRALKELERGLSPASLPRTVRALIDTTRARLAGPIVRDPEVLKRSKIRLGTDGTVISRTWDGFVSRKEIDRR